MTKEGNKKDEFKIVCPACKQTEVRFKTDVNLNTTKFIKLGSNVSNPSGLVYQCQNCGAILGAILEANKINFTGIKDHIIEIEEMQLVNLARELVEDNFADDDALRNILRLAGKLDNWRTLADLKGINPDEGIRIIVNELPVDNLEREAEESIAAAFEIFLAITAVIVASMLKSLGLVHTLLSLSNGMLKQVTEMHYYMGVSTFGKSPTDIVKFNVYSSHVLDVLKNSNDGCINIGDLKQENIDELKDVSDAFSSLFASKGGKA